MLEQGRKDKKLFKMKALSFAKTSFEKFVFCRRGLVFCRVCAQTSSRPNIVSRLRFLFTSTFALKSQRNQQNNTIFNFHHFVLEVGGGV